VESWRRKRTRLAASLRATRLREYRAENCS
jgi:hypothetical protein